MNIQKEIGSLYCFAAKRALCILLAAVFIFFLFPFPANAAGEPAAVYVDCSSTGSGDGSSAASPLKDFRQALGSVADGGTIYIMSGGASVNDDTNNDAPLLINKKVTIAGDGARNSLDLHTGSIILGADVTFKDMTLSPDNTSMFHGIFANGHALTIENVVKDSGSTGTLDIYAGGMEGHTDSAGNNGSVVISGASTEIADIYAGSYGETCTYNTSVSLSGTLASVGTVYGTNYGGTATGGDVSISLSDSNVKTVAGAQGGYVAADITANTYQRSTAFSNMTLLSVKSGACEVNPSSLSSVSAISVEAGGILNLSTVMDSNNNAFTVASFQGGGTLRMGDSDTLTITNSLTGTTEFQTTKDIPMDGSTSGRVNEDHVYIDASSAAAKTGTFTFTPLELESQEAMSLVDDGGKWTAKLSANTQPAITKVTVMPSVATLNKGGTQQFRAIVSGTGSYDEAVTWSVSGGKGANTKIDENGKLTIDASETSSSVTVTATSKADTSRAGTAAVTVRSETSNFANYVVFVTFKGQDASAVTDNFSDIRGIYDHYMENNADVSFKNYIRTISNGSVIVDNYFPQENDDGTLGEIITLDKTLQEYIDSAGGSVNSAMNSIIDDIITKLDGFIFDTAAHAPDRNGDGALDNLSMVVYSAEASKDDLYSHKTSYAGSSETANLGCVIRSYNFITADSVISGLGANSATISHEFLHTLGLLDLYRSDDGIDYNERVDEGYPVHLWDIMASTTTPQFPLSVSRADMGWIDAPDEITNTSTEDTYTLTCVSSAAARSDTVAYKIVSPVSQQEYFMVEYRKKNSDWLGSFGFEQNLQSSGLIIYRVNEKAAYKSNYNITDNDDAYVYVFRPAVDGVTEKKYWINHAAFGAGESYGSTDLSATHTDSSADETLYYSDGSNSGIKIDVVSAEDSTLTFKVSFADYSAEGLWDNVSLGESISAVSPASVMDSSGAFYFAYTSLDEVSTNNISVRKYDGSAWSVPAPALTGVSQPDLCCYEDTVYLACSSSGAATVYRLDANKWTLIYKDTSGAYANHVTMFSDSSGIYMGYVSGGKKYVIKNALTGAVLSDSLSVSDSSNPAFCRFNGEFYVLYSDYAGTYNGTPKLAEFSSGTWKTIKTFSLTNSNLHQLAAGGSKLYAFVGLGGTGYAYTEYNGTSFNDEVPSVLPADVHELSMIYTDALYLGVVDGATYAAQVYTRGENGFEQLGQNVDNGINAMAFAAGGGKAYAAVVSKSGALYVRSTDTPEVPAETDPAPAPVVDDLTVTLTPPTTFKDKKIWFDGVAVTATVSGGKYTAKAPSNSAKVATMYEYNSNGVATGMYVWLLKFSDHKYTVTPVSSLEDILSYHGFAIRVKGYSGIRFKSGIAQTVKTALISSAGYNGFKLSEYGTVVMRAANMPSYPLIKGGAKTSYGKAYWKDSSGIHDAVFETKSGRARFTSVLTNIPAADYETEYAFRSYIILSYGGKSYTVYGPPVSRSIYTVAKQVMAAGEFSQGTVQYNFVKNIITVSESS